MHAWLKAVRLPALIAAGSFFAWPLTTYVLPGVIATAGFNVTRVSLMVWAGYVAVRVGGSRLLGAAAAGIAIMVVDHIVLKGGWFLIEYARGQTFGDRGPNAYLMAFGGVVVSFVMFTPVADIAGLCGGILGRKAATRHAA